MQILLDATGESSQLHPLTESIPSPMMPILSRPALLYPIELLARQGCKDFLISLHNFPGYIESFLGTGRRWGVSLTYILQQAVLGTGGMVKQARSFLHEPFLVLPADRIVDFDVDDLVAHHRRNGRIVTAIVHSQGPENGRVFQVEQGSIVGLHTHIDTKKRYFETGAYLFEPEALRWIPENGYFDIYRQLIPALWQAGEDVAAYVSSGFWNPMCTFDAYYETQMSFINKPKQQDGNQPALMDSWQDGKEMAPGIRVGRNHVIHPSVRLAAPVFIGNNCYIGRDVELGSGTVIGSNVAIDDGATVSQSVILDNTYVGRLVNLNLRLVQQSLVVDLPSGISTEIEDHFLLGHTYQSVAEAGGHAFFDKSIALLGLVLTLWLTIPISLLAWLVTGTVFVKVPRFHKPGVGKQKMDEEKPGRFFLHRFATRKGDGRLTSFGRFLQKWDLHRLPELWNVVSGELMLVGVKPLTKHEFEKITEPWQQKRFESKPGMTGLWYVQDGYFNELDEALIADVYYVVTHSWQLDLKLLWQTPGGWWQKARRQTDKL
ncbi:MAG: hypothetical protein GY943_00425 [Chloroflexi bacterium]|nr:hypothetical protein [Chloroflexota bacterium]